MHKKSKNTISRQQSLLDISLKNASGKVPYNMTNDYMFRAVLQENNYVLKGLISSLLHLKPEEIKSAEITNPIIFGESVNRKEMHLDINVILNNSQIINLEMQAANLYDWHNRSVSYLCRSYDALCRGQKYKNARPVIHIGFLDYCLEGMLPEFYATYKLCNIKNHQIYSDNLTLAVVNLKQIKLATDEDKKYGIDKWARLFKAKTWEAVKMLAKENSYIDEASRTMYKMCADAMIQLKCREQEEFEMFLQQQQEELAQAKAALADKDAVIADKDAALSEAQKIIEWAKAHGYSES